MPPPTTDGRDGRQPGHPRDAVISSNNDEVAKVSDNNRLTGIRRGEAAVLIRYEGNYGVANVSVMADRTGFAWAAMPEYNFIDKHVWNKLERLGIPPSDLADDATFLRRAFLDVIGPLPTAAEAATSCR